MATERTETVTMGRTTGILPSVNDIAAVAILAGAYLVRIASLGPGGFDVPWWLTVTTDAVLPVMAGTWLFVATAYVLVDRMRRCH